MPSRFALPVIAIGFILAVIIFGGYIPNQPADTKVVKAGLPEPKALHFTAHEGETMDVVNDNVGSAYGVMGITVRPQVGPPWTRVERVAIIACSKPKIDWNTKTAQVVWFETTDGYSGFLVECE